MLAAERTTPCGDDAGDGDADGRVAADSSKWSTIWAMTSATASGVDAAGVSMRSRLGANVALLEVDRARP